VCYAECDYDDAEPVRQTAVPQQNYPVLPADSYSSQHLHNQFSSPPPEYAAGEVKLLSYTMLDFYFISLEIKKNLMFPAHYVVFLCCVELCVSVRSSQC